MPEQALGSKTVREKGVITSTTIRVNPGSHFEVDRRDADGYANVVERMPSGTKRHLLHLPVNTALAVCTALNQGRGEHINGH
jgi:hypothetical protein